jgi:phosphate transport system permease protein
MASDQPNRLARRTKGAVHWQDRLAKVIITVGGVGVIATVLAIGVYLAFVALPLFSSASVANEHSTSLTRATAPTSAAAGSADSSSVDGDAGKSLATAAQGPITPLAVWADEYRQCLAVLTRDQQLHVHSIGRDGVVETRDLKAMGGGLDGQSAMTASAWSAEYQEFAFGYADGSAHVGTIEFVAELLSPGEVAEAFKNMGVGETRPYLVEGTRGAIRRISAEQYRVVSAKIELPKPAKLPEGEGPVIRLALSHTGETQLLVAMREDGRGSLDRVTTRRPLGGGAPRVSFDSTPIRFEPREGGVRPLAVYCTSDASHVISVWEDGFAQRYAVDEVVDGAVSRVESASLLKPGRKVTSHSMLLGGLTLLLGTDDGKILAAFVARQPEKGFVDGRALAVAHTLEAFDAPITTLGLSLRGRMIAMGDAQGRVAVRSVLAEKDIAEMDAGGVQSPVVGLAITRADGLVALHENGAVRTWTMDPGHPDASLKSLFGKVHYEGEPGPAYTYQSSSASDSAEVKYSLTPLIHGTLKATFFAMIFAAPIAIGAAIYTSEFMHPTWRNRVKPAIEMMASLPSVVLGFVAAMIVAPFMRDLVSALLVGIVLVPLVIILAAHVWQLVPGPVLARTSGTRRLLMATGALLVGVGVSVVLGPVMERVLFQPSRADVLVASGSYEKVPQDQWPSWVGTRETMSPDEERPLRATGQYFREGGVVKPIEPADEAGRERVRLAAEAQGLDQASLRRWLDGSIGGPWPGWFLIFMPVAMILAWALQPTGFKRWLEGVIESRTAIEAGLWRLGRLAIGIVLAVGLSAIGASVASSMGWDMRDVFFGPFNQRNSLVVGLVMGFAVIPIIYTISEDAMSSVPASLRTASLGSGATPWQTAIRVVLPVAMSGVFSALMIGLGRAVGETMIVVMATGNTPSMDWSMFSGFRTLSANIAVELPEAPKGETHYRVLFLCGLVLFVMTFAINTTAELVRQRVRKRIASL